jgi:hypothetical protein
MNNEFMKNLKKYHRSDEEVERITSLLEISKAKVSTSHYKYKHSLPVSIQKRWKNKEQ